MQKTKVNDAHPSSFMLFHATEKPDFILLGKVGFFVVLDVFFVADTPASTTMFSSMFLLMPISSPYVLSVYLARLNLLRWSFNIG